ncbi:hypothetical protein HDU98_009515 [Podochytrium sp. JEL0797]|nr:hypothetical protein HDU98_009515 [Podochytrium sp. JEL0797]
MPPQTTQHGNPAQTTGNATILICGAAHSGKTTLKAAFAAHVFGQRFVLGDEYAATLGSHTTRLAVPGFGKVSITEVGGSHTGTLLQSAARDSDAVLLCYDVGDAASFAAVEQLVEAIEAARGCVVPMVLVGCKVDSVLKGRKREVSPEDGKHLAASLGIPFRETTARAPMAVYGCFATLLTLVNELYKANISPTSSSVLEDYHNMSSSSPSLSSQSNLQPVSSAASHASLGSFDLLNKWRHSRNSNGVQNNISRPMSDPSFNPPTTTVAPSTLENAHPRPSSSPSQPASNTLPTDSERYFVTRVLQDYATNPISLPPPRKGSLRHQRDVMFDAHMAGPFSPGVPASADSVYGTGTPDTLVYSPLYSPGGEAIVLPYAGAAAGHAGIGKRGVESRVLLGEEKGGSSSSKSRSASVPPKRPVLNTTGLGFSSQRNGAGLVFSSASLASPGLVCANMDEFLASAAAASGGPLRKGVHKSASSTSVTVGKLQNMLDEIEEFEKDVRLSELQLGGVDVRGAAPPPLSASADFMSPRPGSVASSSGTAEFWEIEKVLGRQLQPIGEDMRSPGGRGAEEFGEEMLVGGSGLEAEAARIALLKKLLGDSVDESSVVAMVRKYSPR